MNRRKSGLISIFALLSMMFFLIFIMVAYNNVMQKSKVQVETEEILVDYYKSTQTASDIASSFKPKYILSNFVLGKKIEKAYEYKVDDINLKDFFPNTNTNTKVIFSGTEISSTKDLAIGEWYLEYDNSINTIEVVTVDKPYINDLSGNGRHLYLKNGTEIKKDDNFNYYLNFDGADDYAQINILDESIDWANGFIIEFEAEWDAFNSWSRIIDFGNGSNSNNIVVANYSTTSDLIMLLVNGSSGSSDYRLRKTTITKNSLSKYVISYEKIDKQTYSVKFLKDGEEIFSDTTSYTLQNTERLLNYIGKSNWSNDQYFKGKLYSLKITQSNGLEIVNYNINTSLNSYIKKINVVGNEYTGKIEDISGNKRNLFLKQGNKICKDSDNRYYLNFDGIDDYAQINILDESIDWANGFTIELEAEWDAFNSWSRIIDFGNGSNSNNIVVANYSTTSDLIMLLVNGSSGSSDYRLRKTTITKSSLSKYVISYEKIDKQTYSVKFLKDGEEIFSDTTSYTLRNTERLLNYIGKSNWSNDQYFKGKLYSLKITQSNGICVFWFDINEWIKLSKINSAIKIIY